MPDDFIYLLKSSPLADKEEDIANKVAFDQKKFEKSVGITLDVVTQTRLSLEKLMGGKSESSQTNQPEKLTLDIENSLKPNLLSSIALNPEYSDENREKDN